MERLTNRNYGEISRAGRIIPYSKHCIGCITKDCDCGIVEDMVKKLVNYEDLEEQGRLVILPCKVGDTVYKVNKASRKVTQHKVREVEDERVVFENYDYRSFNCFGKTLFLTREEAEAKLKELRGGENE